MKRLLILFTLLSFLIPVEGQFLRTGSSYTNNTVASSYCDEYQAVYDAMTNKPSAANAGYQNSMVKSLVDGGYWTSRMELFYLFAQESTSATELSLDWVNPTGSYNLVDVGSVNPYEHAVQYQGIDANGSDDYLDTDYTPSTDMVNISLTSTTLASWQIGEVSGDISIGAGSASGNRYLSLYPRDGGAISARIHAGSSALGASSTSIGLTMATRTASDALAGYQNGAQTGTDNDASAASAVALSLYIFARHDDSDAKAYYMDGIISLVFVMNGISSDDATAIYNIINTYMTAIGHGI